MATSLQTLAEECSRYLTRIERKEEEEGEKIVTLTDDAPQWFTDLCRKAHGEMLPDDWKYEFIQDALDALVENEDADDITLDSDIYNHELLRWVSSNLGRASYVDEAVADLGMDEFSLFTALGWGQIREREEVLGIVRSELEARIQESDEE